MCRSLTIPPDETGKSPALCRRGHAAQGMPIVYITAPIARLQGRRAGKRLENCPGEFVAIFDADFMPEPDFCAARSLFPWRCERPRDPSKIGMFALDLPQPRYSSSRKWDHLLDGPFVVEHGARSAAALFQFQRHRRRWRRQSHRRSRRWSTTRSLRHRSFLSRPSQGLEISLFSRRSSAPRAARRADGFKAQQARWPKA